MALHTVSNGKASHKYLYYTLLLQVGYGRRRRGYFFLFVIRLMLLEVSPLKYKRNNES